MADNEEKTGVIQITHKQLATAILVVLFGSNTTSLLNVINPNIRADAFTMTDWLRGKAEIVEKFELHKSEVTKKIVRLEVNQKECLRRLYKQEE